jgi:hypothetical protein
MWLYRATAAKCYMLSARKLGIEWGDTPQYWHWISLTDSRSVKPKPLFILFFLERTAKALPRFILEEENKTKVCPVF